MENATKALLIAGGVLIAIIIISMFVMMYGRMANIEKEQQEKIELEQLTAFNAEFEAFNRKVMYGTDVITLINKVTENNKKYAENNDYQIIITVNGTVMTNSSSLVGTDQEQSIFKCTKVEYNELGRICKMEINSK